jgi:hypothetical protein
MPIDDDDDNGATMDPLNIPMFGSPTPGEDRAKFRQEFDEAVFGLVAKGYVEIVPGVDGEPDSPTGHDCVYILSTTRQSTSS